MQPYSETRTTPADASAIEFRVPKSHSTQTILCVLFGLGALLFGLLMFVVLLVVGGGNQLTLHATTTFPILIGVFSLARGWQMMNAPAYIRLFREGVCVGKQTGERLVPWTDIASIAVDQTGGAIPTKVIRLKDSADKTIESISSVEQIDELVARLRACVDAIKSPVSSASSVAVAENSATPTDSKGELETSACPVTQQDEGQGQNPKRMKATELHRKRGRKRALGFGLFSLFMLAAGVGIIGFGLWESYRLDALQNRAIKGTGIVEERKVAPNGVTKRLYVKVTGENGQEEVHNFEVTDALYESLSEGDEIPVRYVPDDPRVAELVGGQVKESDFTKSPTGSYVLGGLGILMSVGIFATAVLAWKGYDIKIDKDHKGLVPIGE